MDIKQDFPPTEGTASEVPDEFASGSLNHIRSRAMHLMEWLFAVPYFPAGPVWAALVLIATSIATELAVQPASYWVDPGTSEYVGFLGISLKWGSWAIVAYLGYMLGMTLILSLLNRKPAFALWIGVCMFHLVDLAQAFSCRTFYFFPFENPINCATVHTVSVTLTGVLWGCLVLVSARFGLIPLLTFGSSEPVEARWTKNLRRASVVWIFLCALAIVGKAAFAPKPVWRTIQTGHSPVGRTEASLAYDTKRSTAVLFGGASNWTPADGWECINDLWEWDGKDWTQLQPEHSPSPRYATGMAFDENRGVTVLFGGLEEKSAYEKTTLGDTWEWNGEDWQEISPSTRPPARQDHAMFFDPVRRTVVLYGGYYIDPNSQTSVFLDDAWEWNGESWQQLFFDEPRRNSASTLIYDPIRQLPLLMDAEGLWAWQESDWTQPGFPASPPGRWGSQMVYDPKIGKIVLFAGFKDKDVFDDTWAYDGQTWQKVMTKVRPPRRTGHNMFYDPIRDSVVVFGGLESGIFYNDMWELVLP